MKPQRGEVARYAIFGRGLRHLETGVMIVAQRKPDKRVPQAGPINGSRTDDPKADAAGAPFSA